MKALILSDQAVKDLARICDYLEEHNPAAARRVMRNLRNKLDLLARFPYLGRERNDMLLNLRCLIVREYLILYEPREDVIEVVHICHSSQDLRELFNV